MQAGAAGAGLQQLRARAAVDAGGLHVGVSRPAAGEDTRKCGCRARRRASRDARDAGTHAPLAPAVNRIAMPARNSCESALDTRAGTVLRDRVDAGGEACLHRLRDFNVLLQPTRHLARSLARAAAPPGAAEVIQPPDATATRRFGHDLQQQRLRWHSLPTVGSVQGSCARTPFGRGSASSHCSTMSFQSAATAISPDPAGFRSGSDSQSPEGHLRFRATTTTPGPHAATGERAHQNELARKRQLQG